MTDNNGLYYMRARYYNPEIKSFINEDTFIGSNLSELNRFTYVSGNPLRRIDPTGRWGEDVHFGDTKIWAMQVGFTEYEAAIIARGNKLVDFLPGTNPAPGWPIIGNQDWHFDRSKWDLDMGTEDTRSVHAREQLEYVKLMIDRNMEKEMWLLQLGYGLHAKQDIYAHMDAGRDARFGIWTLHNDPDNTEKYDSKYWDRVNGEWQFRNFVEDNIRWTDTREASLQYLGEVRNYYDRK